MTTLACMPVPIVPPAAHNTSMEQQSKAWVAVASACARRRSPNVASLVGGAGRSAGRHALDDCHEGAGRPLARLPAGRPERLHCARVGHQRRRQLRAPDGTDRRKAGVPLLAVGQRKCRVGAGRGIAEGGKVGRAAHHQPAWLRDGFVGVLGAYGMQRYRRTAGRVCWHLLPRQTPAAQACAQQPGTAGRPLTWAGRRRCCRRPGERHPAPQPQPAEPPLPPWPAAAFCCAVGA